MPGVVQFDRNAHQPSLIMATYDPARTRALALLNKLTRLGFNASLAGIQEGSTMQTGSHPDKRRKQRIPLLMEIMSQRAYTAA